MLAAFPVHDPQFWIATVIALFALAFLLRSVLPIPFLSRRSEQRKHQRRVPLTIEGRARKR